MKKVISIILAVLILAAILPLSAFATENTGGIIDSGTCGTDGDNLTWVLYKDGELVIDGTGKMKDYNNYNSCSPWLVYKNSIYSVSFSKSIESIGNSAFYNCNKIQNINIPDGVTSIGNHSFYGIHKLSEVKIPDSVTHIGEKAFSSCYNLASIIIPDSVVSLGDYTFSWCDLKKVVIGSGISSIPIGMFSNCDELEYITIPANVTYVSQEAFGNCPSIKTVYYKGTQEQWNNISFDSGNGYLKSASDIQFNAVCHNYAQTVIAPSCSKNGYTKYECLYCGEIYNDTYTDIIAHSTTNGKCYMCEKFIVEVGETVSVSVTIDKQAKVEWNLAENTASVTGTSSSSVILGSFIRITESVDIKGEAVGKNTIRAVSDGEIISTAELEILEHTHKHTISSVTAPTCIQKGFSAYTCPCGDSYNDDYTDITEHDYMPITLDPTCTEKGFTEYLCSCGKSYVTDYTDALGHSCVWFTAAEAEIGVEGIEYQQCVICDEIFEERIIPALEAPVTLGDVNGDGNINASDARLALRISAKLDAPTEAQSKAADINGDGKVNASDARIILRVAAKLETL